MKKKNYNSKGNLKNTYHSKKAESIELQETYDKYHLMSDWKVDDAYKERLEKMLALLDLKENYQEEGLYLT